MNGCYHCLRINIGTSFQCAKRHPESDFDEVKDFINIYRNGWEYDAEKPKKFDDNRKLFLNEI